MQYFIPTSVYKCIKKIKTYKEKLNISVYKSIESLIKLHEELPILEIIESTKVLRRLHIPDIFVFSKLFPIEFQNRHYTIYHDNAKLSNKALHYILHKHKTIKQHYSESFIIYESTQHKSTQHEVSYRLRQIITNHTHWSADFLIRFQEYMLPEAVAKSDNLTDEVIEKCGAVINWRLISLHRELTEEFIEKYKDKLDWDIICCRSIDIDLLDKYASYLKWDMISIWCRLTRKFIIKHKDKLDLNILEQRKYLYKISPFARPYDEERIFRRLDGSTYIFVNDGTYDN